MAIITVTSTADQGAGSLRQAISTAKEGDTIRFANKLAQKTIPLTSGQLILDKSITLDGRNVPGLTISGKNSSRVLRIEKNTDVTLNTLRIADGEVDGPGGGILARQGSLLKLINTQVENNTSTQGGGLYLGHLAKATVIDSEFEGNDGTPATKNVGLSAGAISTDSRAELSIQGTTFNNNIGFNGGAIYAYSTTKFAIADSTFKNNTAQNRAGGGAIFTDGINPFGPSDRSAGGTLTIRNSRFENNQADGGGGALFLYGYGKDQTVIEDSVFVGNTANISPKGIARGGAIQSNMGLTIKDSTFADNTAVKQGGALWLNSKRPVAITNSTFSGNEVVGDAGGAMFLNTKSTPVNITNSTIAYNTAGRANGALWYAKNHAVTLKNSIVAFNTAQQDRRQNQVGFQAFDGGGNIEFSPDSKSMPVLANSLVADPKLAPLKASDGTLVHPLKPDSPAIDAGIRAGAPTTDQRGQQRDNRVDVGAFEHTASTPNETGATIGEYGRLSLNHQWQTVALDDTYTNPVVVVSDPTFNGADPAAIRLRNVGKNSFQVRLQEPNYEDGTHINESVSYLVMEAGDWELADGTRISAGTSNASRLTAQGFNAVKLKKFDATPTVLSQVQTNNGSDWVTTRTQEPSSQGFQLAMQEEEALNKSGHTKETLGWLAIEQGSASDGDTLLQGGTTGRSHDHNRSQVSFESGFDTAPSLIAKLGSFYGSDTANLRLQNITRHSFGVSVQEETSLDTELSHTTESVSFLALEGKSGSLTGLRA
ncbi:MAG: right-handed parallel beta-helix repeat-containing protein [Cyanobacteria bacterium J06626_18]